MLIYLTYASDASDLLNRRNLTDHAIAQLCGQPASSFQPPRNACLPSHIPEPPLNSPASLLRQRPDIAEAERILAARNADIGVAIGRSLPSLKLNGSLSLESLTLSDLLTQGSRAFALGPELNLPVFSGGAADTRIASAKDRHAEATANWRHVVITAVREVEDALASQSSALLIEQQQRARTEAAAGNAALSLERHRHGLVNFLEVADAQQEELSASRVLVRATASRLSASVALIKALGGGWQPLHPKHPNR